MLFGPGLRRRGALLVSWTATAQVLIVSTQPGQDDPPAGTATGRYQYIVRLRNIGEGEGPADFDGE